MLWVSVVWVRLWYGSSGRRRSRHVSSSDEAELCKGRRLACGRENDGTWRQLLSLTSNSSWQILSINGDADIWITIRWLSPSFRQMAKTSLQSVQSQVGRVQSGRRSRSLKCQIVRWWMGQEQNYGIATNKLRREAEQDRLTKAILGRRSYGMASLEEHYCRRWADSRCYSCSGRWLLAWEGLLSPLLISAQTRTYK